MGGRGYPVEFRRRVLYLLEAGRKVADLADDPGISDQTIYNWRRQDRIHRGVETGITTAEHAELGAARKRIRELESGAGRASASHRAAQGTRQPKRRFAAIEVMVAEGLPAPVACRVLEVSQSGFYASRTRTPSARSLRHAWLTEQIRQIHGQFRGVDHAHAVLPRAAH